MPAISAESPKSPACCIPSVVIQHNRMSRPYNDIVKANDCISWFYRCVSILSCFFIVMFDDYNKSIINLLHGLEELLASLAAR